MRKVGKRGKINQEANKRLKQLFLDKGITRCELTGSDMFLSFTHRHPRVWYYSCPELLWDFNQVILITIQEHQKIEGNRELTEQVFRRLRGDEPITKIS